jgi:hypothetical protein
MGLKYCSVRWKKYSNHPRSQTHSPGWKWRVPLREAAMWKRVLRERERRASMPERWRDRAKESAGAPVREPALAPAAPVPHWNSTRS